jgi:CheY-like chemotaxis protein
MGGQVLSICRRRLLSRLAGNRQPDRTDDAVADGIEVLQALRILPYDLVFMDIRMPEMDGITAPKEIRKFWPDNGPKIIAITAFARKGDRERCLEAGMDGYISKPAKLDDLVDALFQVSVPALGARERFRA